MNCKLLGGIVLAGLVATGWLAAGEDKAPAPAAGGSKPAVTSTNQGGPYIALGYLEKRGKVITIKSSPHGTVYSVATTDGKVLLENATPEQLRAQAPEIYDVFKTGVASANTARGSRYDGDARIRPMSAGWSDARN